MAIDVDKLRHLHDFDCEMHSVGKFSCRSLSNDLTAEFTKAARDEKQGSESLARRLLAHVAFKNLLLRDGDDESANDIALSQDEIGQVSEAELGDFCRQFLAKNDWLLNTHDDADLQCAESESPFDFLKRAFQHYGDERKRYAQRLVKSASGNLFTSSTVDAMLRNSSISDHLNKTIEILKRGTPPIASGLSTSMREVLDPSMSEPGLPERHIPDNPIRETNKKLGSLLQHIEDLRPMAAAAGQLISSMNETALRMQVDYIANSIITERSSRNALWIAVISVCISVVGIVVSTVFSYQSYADAKVSADKSDVQIRSLQGEIRDLSALQRQAYADTVKALADGQRTVAASVQRKSVNDLPVGKK